MARIFVSYRRQDRAGHAGRIFDHLRAYFGSGRLFMDLEGIDPGADFTKVLEERVAEAEVVVAVIGPDWMSALGPDGKRRIETEGDYVRSELAGALAKGIEVIAVLVAGAAVPPSGELPKDLAALTQRQMYVLSDTAFDAGMARLIQAVERSAARTRELRRLAPRPKSEFGKRRWARLLLLYEPVRPVIWILHGLFFAGLAMAIFAPLIVWGVASRGEAALAALGLLGWLLVLRGIVLLLEPDAVVSPWRRWLLLYNPPRITMGAVHLAFVLMALVCIVSPAGLAEMIHRQENDLARADLVTPWIFLTMVAFVLREIGASKDPLKPALVDPNWFARMFCIWKPRRAAAWLPRILYYAAVVAFMALFPSTLVGPDNNFGNVDPAANRGSFILCGLLAAIAVSARGAARAMEVGWAGDRGPSAMQRVRAGLLLYVPWKRTGWVAAALFWIGLVLLSGFTANGPTILKLVGMDPTARVMLAIFSILLVVLSWGWAQLYRPPAKWTETPSEPASPNPALLVAPRKVVNGVLGGTAVALPLLLAITFTVVSIRDGSGMIAAQVAIPPESDYFAAVASYLKTADAQRMTVAKAMTGVGDGSSSLNDLKVALSTAMRVENAGYINDYQKSITGKIPATGVVIATSVEEIHGLFQAAMEEFLKFWPDQNGAHIESGKQTFLRCITLMNRTIAETATKMK